MGEIVAEWLGHGVNAVLSAAMISAIVSLLAVTQILNAQVSEQQGLAEEINEYREFNQYDFTHVYPQDIITTIFQYRGSPAVYVNSALGTYAWTTESAPCDYATEDIAALIDQTVIYDSSIGYGANGEIVSLNFVTHVDGCGR